MKKTILLLLTLFVIASTVFAQSEPDYLCFEVEAGTKIKFGKPSKIQYSYNKTTWYNMTSNGVTVTKDCCIYFRGYNAAGFNTGWQTENYGHFSLSKPAKCYGNIMTLIDGTGNTSEIPNEYCFYRLFYNCPITTAPQLPALVLKNDCYTEMFRNCSNLIQAPQLPATTLAYRCYSNMFRDCSNLKQAPVLPATTLAILCYEGMFSDCTSLTTPPVLPATTLVERCYSHMFYNCSSLTKTPKLPALILDIACYDNMFANCTSIENTPLLPAITLKKWCYSSMFAGCTNLRKTAPILFTITPHPNLNTQCDPYAATTICTNMFQGCKKLNYISVRFTDWHTSTTWRITSTSLEKEYSYTPFTDDWVKGVATSGTFICPSILPQKFGVDNIPSGWTVKSVESLSIYPPHHKKSFPYYHT